MEEDCGAFAADCVILCCCCECFLLQVFIFVFFKTPRKIAQKMKKFMTRKRLRGKMRRGAKTFSPTREEDCEEQHLSGDGSRFSCMEDIEGMFQELSLEGEFMFGSFWRHGDSANDLDFGNSQYEVVKNRDHSFVIAHCTRCRTGFTNPNNEVFSVYSKIENDSAK